MKGLDPGRHYYPCPGPNPCRGGKVTIQYGDKIILQDIDWVVQRGAMGIVRSQWGRQINPAQPARWRQPSGIRS
ncbi:MAG: hypothetical protein IPF93_15230 [Saprospiraceae bacterium]|nr:hypothetical protein [Saprospiraceae bacterium]